jgi:hypothetical protein
MDRTLNALPIMKASTADIAEASIIHPYEDRDFPSRKALLILMALVKRLPSNILIVDEVTLIPYSDKVDPNLAQERIDILEPTFIESSALIDDPILHIP